MECNVGYSKLSKTTKGEAKRHGASKIMGTIQPHVRLNIYNHHNDICNITWDAE